MISNEEILRFADWWISARYRPGWSEKFNEFINTIFEFQKDGEIRVVIMDQDKNGYIDSLENVPSYPPGHSICCIYKGDE